MANEEMKAIVGLLLIQAAVEEVVEVCGEDASKLISTAVAIKHLAEVIRKENKDEAERKAAKPAEPQAKVEEPRVEGQLIVDPSKLNTVN